MGRMADRCREGGAGGFRLTALRLPVEGGREIATGGRERSTQQASGREEVRG